MPTAQPAKPPIEKVTFEDLDKLMDAVDPTVAFMLHGPPGIGKTAWVLSNPDLLPCEQIGIATRQPEDIGGCPSIDKEKRITEFLPCAWFRRFAHPDAVGSIFFDEYDKGTEEKQVAVMRILSERTLEDAVLGDNVRILLAANRREDAAGAFHEMPKVVKNRLTHFEIVPNFDVWARKFANKEGNVHPVIVAFLEANKNYFCKYSPNSVEYGFPTPRSWTMASKFLYANDRKGLSNGLTKKALVGCLGRDTVSAFWDFKTYVADCSPLSELAKGNGFPDMARADKWVALVARCVSAVEQDLAYTPPRHDSLKHVTQILLNMPPAANNYRLLLAMYLQRRPSTADVWLNEQIVGKDHCRQLGKVLLKLQGAMLT